MVRLLAARAGVRAIGREDNNLVLRLSARAQERAGKVTPHFGRRAWVGRGQMWLALKEDQGDWRTVLFALLLRLGPANRGAGGITSGGWELTGITFCM